MKALTIYCVPGTNAYSASQMNKFDAFEKYVESSVKIIFFFWEGVSCLLEPYASA